MSSRVVRKKDAAPAPESESKLEPTSAVDLSWADDREMPILGDIERDMTEMKVMIVGVKRSEETQLPDGKALVKLDVEVVAPIKEGKRIVKRRFRLLWPDAVWSSADSGHRVCNGRGYVLTGPDGYGKSRPMPVEVPDLDPKHMSMVVIEYRISCACASARFRRRHPEIVWDNSYGFIPLEGAGAKAVASALEIAEFEAEDAVAEEVRVNGEERLREQLSALLTEAVRHETDAAENSAEIERANAERQAVIDGLQAIIDSDLLPQKDRIQIPVRAAETMRKVEEEILRDEEARFALAIDVAEKRLAELKELAHVTIKLAASKADAARREHKKLALETDAECKRIDARIAETQIAIDRVPVPGRLGRLRRERRIHLERAAELRERIAKKGIGAPVSPPAAPQEVSS